MSVRVSAYFGLSSNKMLLRCDTRVYKGTDPLRMSAAGVARWQPAGVSVSRRVHVPQQQTELS